MSEPSQRIKTKASKVSAFTIVELLIVVVVIAILAAITMVSYNGISSKARESALSSSLSSVAKKVSTYAIANTSTLPTTLSQAGITDSSSITYQYTTNTSITPNMYCISATSSGKTSHIAGTSDGADNHHPRPMPRT